jgi:hypothetical protein
MESHGEGKGQLEFCSETTTHTFGNVLAGKIHCSATTKALLDTYPDFVLVERGVTKIKVSQVPGAGRPFSLMPNHSLHRSLATWLESVSASNYFKRLGLVIILSEFS